MDPESTSTAPAVSPVLGGGAAQATPPAAATPPASPETPPSQAPASSDWRTALPEQLRSNPALSKVKDVGDLATQYLNAQKLIGQKTIKTYTPPPADASPEDIQQFYAAVGRPDNPEGYELDKSATEGLQVDEKAMAEFKKTFHGEGLSRKQVKAITTKYAEHVKATAQAAQMAALAAEKAGFDKLRREWAGDFDANLQAANDAFAKVADPELQELFASNRVLANNPAVIRLFHNLAAKGREDTLRGAGGAPSQAQTPEAALNALRTFDRENMDVIYNIKKVSPTERESILAQRLALYRKAYPEKKGE